MSTSIWRPLRAELRRILLSVSGVPDSAFEEQEFKPTPGVAWIKERLVKGPSFTSTLGSHGTTEEQGIYELDLQWPVNGVKADGEDLADKIRLAFWHGRGIESAGADPIKGRVTASEARRMVPGEPWVVYPVRVSFFVRRLTRQGFPPT